MTRTSRHGWALAAAAIGLSVAIAHAQEEDSRRGQAQKEPSVIEQRTEAAKAEDVIKAWPEKTRAAARAMIEKYGQPDEVDRRRVAWRDKGRWMEVAVYRQAKKHAFPMPHQDFLENTIRYQVPAQRVGELRRFDSALSVDTAKGTLSSRCDSEKGNTLALNLAHEIVTGKRDVDSAKLFMADRMKEELAGKSSPYTEGLIFTSEEETGELPRTQPQESMPEPGTRPDTSAPEASEPAVPDQPRGY